MNRLGIMYSVNDLAGLGIAEVLVSKLKCREVTVKKSIKASSYSSNYFDVVLAGFKEETIDFEFLDDVVDVDFYIILSKHRSEAGIKSFTVHSTGNPWRNADVGGKPLELSIANPQTAKTLLLNLSKFRDEWRLSSFDVTYEVTHHGPTSLRKPITFIEIGSCETEWKLREAREVVAEAVLNLVENGLVSSYIPVVGFGGNHYASRFSERALKTEEAYGHMIAKYVIDKLTDNELNLIVGNAITKNAQKILRVIIEKKLRSTYRKTIRDVASQLNINYLET
ncbi:MAG: D-aminoacyl-tRNA deacylase [Candidatus Methanomethylicia archaeon]